MTLQQEFSHFNNEWEFTSLEQQTTEQLNFNIKVVNGGSKNYAN